MNETINNKSAEGLSGFRLHSVELLNWGTFHEKVWRIEPNGCNALLTGDVGSGKSTLVDALTCLIVPHQKISFNKAAGAEKNERNLITYIKGEYKNTKNDDTDTGFRDKPVTLRYNNPLDTTFSVVLANFTNEAYRESVALAQIFWIENDKVQKLLIIREKELLSIREHLTNIVDPRELRKRMKQLPHTETFDDNFARYSQRFRQLFGMTTDKAIDLFYQTVSMKSVTNLTTFVREQMLERTDIKTQIEDLKKRFDDLNKAHAAVLEARRQRDTLLPMVDASEAFRKIEEQIVEIDGMLNAVPAYFALRKIALLETEISDCERKLMQINGRIAGLDEALTFKRDSIHQIKQDIRSNGGERLEKIAEEIHLRTRQAETKKEKHRRYSELTSKCDLETAQTDTTFFRNLKKAEVKLDELKERQQQILAEHGSAMGDYDSLQVAIKSQEEELDSLRKRKNQIPLEFLSMRKTLADSLDLSEQDLPFTGELMKVRDDEKEWEGALERLLRGFGLSLLVPDRHYQSVSHYINQRRLTDAKNRGMRLEYFKVPYAVKPARFNNEIEDDSVVNKIEVKTGTVFEDWLQQELDRRFNLRCVSIQEFQRIPGDVITREGQYKVGNQRHIKDDRRDLWDRANFVLGWTNEEKIKAIATQLETIRQRSLVLEERIIALKSEMQSSQDKQSNLSQIISYKDWLELNWKEEIAAITSLEHERDELQSTSNVLNTLQKRLDTTTNEVQSLESEKDDLIGRRGILSTKVEEYQQEIEECRKAMNALTESEVGIWFPKIEGQLVDAKRIYTVKNIDKTREDFFKAKSIERVDCRERQTRARDRIIHTMREYKDKFPADALELSDEVEARHEYLARLESILNEGLPAHEATLKMMLNKNTIDDIVTFDSKLDMHEKEIRNKIRNINQHLREIDFNKGTYIELIADRNRDQDIRIFKEELKACYSNILDTNDAYTEGRFNEVQKILNRFRSNETKDIDWTNKVTDVRNWFDFNASEKWIETNEEKEYYSGSSGKSGGQKEKLAYTIIASALAYQFGLRIGESKSRSFRFAVIDEAFGKGSDASAEYGLELFKKLNLQLLIVTPLQKIHVIENYINTVHYVSNVEGNNSELQNMTVEEYREQKLARSIAGTGIVVADS
ncbi:MAG TPA: ATP-binding protein [Chryseolinea sp.]|nr:ATP-binding protein [Chryseolinea sp.]